MGSPAFSMDSSEWKQYGIDFAIAVGGFTASWLFTDLLPKIDQSNTTGMLTAAGIVVVVRFLRSWLPNTAK